MLPRATNFLFWSGDIRSEWCGDIGHFGLALAPPDRGGVSGASALDYSSRGASLRCAVRRCRSTLDAAVVALLAARRYRGDEGIF